MRTIIRKIEVSEWQEWKKLRLAALQNSPESFGSTFEEESVCLDQKFEDDLKQNDVFGAFLEGQLVGCIGFWRWPSVKAKHEGTVWGMYVKPEFRRQKIAAALIEAVIAHAKTLVIQLQLSCVTSNVGAIKLYEKYGFKSYAIESRSMKMNETFYDEFRMIKKLD